jgi:hypothetical protein
MTRVALPHIFNRLQSASSPGVTSKADVGTGENCAKKRLPQDRNRLRRRQASGLFLYLLRSEVKKVDDATGWKSFSIIGSLARIVPSFLCPLRKI